MMNTYCALDNINHQIRTPLAGILGMVHGLGKDPLTPRQKNCMQAIDVASAELLSAVEDLLNQSAVKFKRENNMQSISIPTTEKRLSKALLVEDNAIVQKVHTSLLEELNYQVDVASSGEEALQLIARNNYDVALVDVGLEGISGVQVVEAIKKHNSDTKVVVVTAFVSDEVRNSCFEAGSDLVLNKPLMGDHLKAQLDFLTK